MSFSKPRAYRPTGQEIQDRIIDLADKNKGSHSPGWPHFDVKGNCLCTSSCCLGRNGCQCRACNHRSHP